MASHQKLWHLTGQTNFDQTSLLYIMNGEVNESNRKINVRIIFNPYHKHCNFLFFDFNVKVYSHQKFTSSIIQ